VHAIVTLANKIVQIFFRFIYENVIQMQSVSSLSLNLFSVFLNISSTFVKQESCKAHFFKFPSRDGFLFYFFFFILKPNQKGNIEKFQDSRFSHLKLTTNNHLIKYINFCKPLLCVIMETKLIDYNNHSFVECKAKPKQTYLTQY
jgi:hypothetical protein